MRSKWCKSECHGLIFGDLVWIVDESVPETFFQMAEFWKFIQDLTAVLGLLGSELQLENFKNH